MPQKPRKDAWLPPNVYERRGRIYHVTRVGKTREWTVICLAGDPDVLELVAAHIERYKNKRVEPPQYASTGKWRKGLQTVLAATKARAKSHGMAFDLDEEYLRQLWQESGGKCALSGIPFTYEVTCDPCRRPWAPSLDRIDSTGGYTKGNVRFVCHVVNVALSNWGEDVLYRMAKFLQSNVRRARNLGAKNGSQMPRDV